MITSEVLIEERLCFGCGYCVAFCPRGCLEISSDKIGPRGVALPSLVHPELCNTCGFCVRMCPHWAIQVYLSEEVPGEAKVTEKAAGTPRLAPIPPLASCPGCQHGTLGRIIVELMAELGLKDNFMVFDGIACGGSSTFGLLDFSDIASVYDDVIDAAVATKRMHSDKAIVAVQNTAKFDFVGFDSFLRAATSGENITIINCNDAPYGLWYAGEYMSPPMEYIVTSQMQRLTSSKYPIHTAELAATIEGVSYSARGALTSPDDYEHTKSYIRTAIEKQTAHIGLNFVEVICACLTDFYETPLDSLQWIKESVLYEFHLGEFRNVDSLVESKH